MDFYSQHLEGDRWIPRALWPGNSAYLQIPVSDPQKPRWTVRRWMATGDLCSPHVCAHTRTHAKGCLQLRFDQSQICPVPISPWEPPQRSPSENEKPSIATLLLDLLQPQGPHLRSQKPESSPTHSFLPTLAQSTHKAHMKPVLPKRKKNRSPAFPT